MEIVRQLVNNNLTLQNRKKIHVAILIITANMDEAKLYTY